jgi:hypothetical protein
MSAKSRFGRGARGWNVHGSSRNIGKHVNPEFWLAQALETGHHPFLTKREMEAGAVDVAWGPRGSRVMPINKSKPSKLTDPSMILHADPTQKG